MPTKQETLIKELEAIFKKALPMLEELEELQRRIGGAFMLPKHCREDMVVQMYYDLDEKQKAYKALNDTYEKKLTKLTACSPKQQDTTSKKNS